MDFWVIIGRLLYVFIFSLIFGFERQKSHNPIGFGAFIFVAIGSCALSITAVTLVPDNPLPLLGSIVTGIGFLGAGALIRTGDKIFGFTTAASIWIFAIMGVLIGAGEYLLGSIVYFFIWVTMFIDKLLELKGIGSYQKRMFIKTNRIIVRPEINELFKKNKIKHSLISVDIEKKNSSLTLIYIIEGRKFDIHKFPNEILKKEWLEECRIE